MGSILHGVPAGCKSRKNIFLFMGTYIMQLRAGGMAKNRTTIKGGEEMKKKNMWMRQID